MKYETVETLDLNDCSYTRFQFLSSHLGLDVKIGTLCSKKVKEFEKVIYVLHGGSGDDRQIVDAGLISTIAEFLRQNPKVQFIFPYIGTSFLRHHSSDKSKDFSTYFWKEVVPNFEISSGSIIERYICGWSLGGHAALNCFFRHWDKFAGVGAHMATLITFDFYDMKQVREFAARSGIVQPYLDILLSELKKEFQGPKDYKMYDPIFLAREIETTDLKNKKIYFDVGSLDNFGLLEGNQSLHDILSEKQIEHSYFELQGGRHDDNFVQYRFRFLLENILGHSH